MCRGQRPGASIDIAVSFDVGAVSLTLEARYA
jgi:hypothetical protein